VVEFVVRKEHLLSELALMQGIVERKTTMPILSNLLLEAGPEGIQLVATDLEVGLKTRCEATIGRQGEVSVQARKLFDVVRSLPDGEIQFRREGDNDLRIECEQAKFTLRGLPSADFPTLPEPALKDPVNLPAAELREMIGRVIFAVTVDDPVYSLNGALFSVEGKTLTLVATDGHRLAYVSRELDMKPRKQAIKRVVHRKTLAELMKILADRKDDEMVACGEVDNHILFRIDRSVLNSRFLEKSFPAYEKVLPSFDDHTVIADRSALAQALKRVSLLSSERSRAVRFHVSKERLEISSNSPDLGEATEVLTVEYGGKGVTIGFNAKYVVDFTEAVDDARVRITLKDGNTQGLFTGEGEQSHDYRYVVMPMQLRGEEVS
jgi:DNA polymerase-3 subunit beta